MTSKKRRKQQAPVRTRRARPAQRAQQAPPQGPFTRLVGWLISPRAVLPLELTRVLTGVSLLVYFAGHLLSSASLLGASGLIDPLVVGQLFPSTELSVLHGAFDPELATGLWLFGALCGAAIIWGRWVRLWSLGALLCVMSTQRALILVEDLDDALLPALVFWFVLIPSGRMLSGHELWRALSPRHWASMATRTAPGLSTRMLELGLGAMFVERAIITFADAPLLSALFGLIALCGLLGRVGAVVGGNALLAVVVIGGAEGGLGPHLLSLVAAGTPLVLGAASASGNASASATGNASARASDADDAHADEKPTPVTLGEAAALPYALILTVAMLGPALPWMPSLSPVSARLLMVVGVWPAAPVPRGNLGARPVLPRVVDREGQQVATDWPDSRVASRLSSYLGDEPFMPLVEAAGAYLRSSIQQRLAARVCSQSAGARHLRVHDDRSGREIFQFSCSDSGEAEHVLELQRVQR